MGELYGEFNLLTMEWKDGLLATAVREAVKVSVGDSYIEHCQCCLVLP